MSDFPYGKALIVGAGPGIGASLARALARQGVAIAVAARRLDRLEGLRAEVGARAFAADAADPAAIERLFAAVDAELGEPDLVVYNASMRVRGPIAELDPTAVLEALKVSAYGGFLVTQQAAQRMLRHGRGAILLTGATAGVKGFAQSSPFAMGKFALRGLAQSAARELMPKGIHVAHVVIDGGVRSAERPDPPDRPDSTLDPDAIAETYLALLRQPRSAWSSEIEIRPWVESF